MSALSAHAADYLALRRALGFKLGRPGVLLPRFVAWLEAAAASTITIESAIAWARLPEGVQPIVWAQRLGAVRGFARYLRTIDPATEIPPAGVLATCYQRPVPYGVFGRRGARPATGLSRAAAAAAGGDL